jgi:hypothetical protein
MENIESSLGSASFEQLSTLADAATLEIALGRRLRRLRLLTAAMVIGASAYFVIAIYAANHVVSMMRLRAHSELARAVADAKRERAHFWGARFDEQLGKRVIELPTGTILHISACPVSHNPCIVLTP